MSYPWKALLFALSQITRENHDLPIVCPYCGNRHLYVRYGYYTRNLFEEKVIKIQRYRCDNDRCPRKTFSILPHAFMRIIRPSLCMLMLVLQMHKQGNSINSIARYTGVQWSTIKGWLRKARTLSKWIEAEYQGNLPCCSVKTLWSTFNRDLSWAFYPARYG